MSQCMASASRPRPRICSATFSAFGTITSGTATEQPSRARAIAMASPIPRPPPVTMAVFPSSRTRSLSTTASQTSIKLERELVPNDRIFSFAAEAEPNIDPDHSHVEDIFALNIAGANDVQCSHLPQEIRQLSPLRLGESL